jgi:hypothetical protein
MFKDNLTHCLAGKYETLQFLLFLILTYVNFLALRNYFQLGTTLEIVYCTIRTSSAPNFFFVCFLSNIQDLDIHWKSINFFLGHLELSYHPLDSTYLQLVCLPWVDPWSLPLVLWVENDPACLTHGHPHRGELPRWGLVTLTITGPKQKTPMTRCIRNKEGGKQRPENRNHIKKQMMSW